MDIAQALELVWREAERSSQALVADDMDVSPSALTRWKQGDTPRGALRQKLIEWAERQPVRPLAPEAVSDESLRRAENMLALSKIQAHAEGILDLLRIITGRQESHVRTMDPWVELEKQGLARDLDAGKKAAISDAVTKAAAKRLQASAAARAPKEPTAPPAGGKPQPQRKAR